MIKEKYGGTMKRSIYLLLLFVMLFISLNAQVLWDSPLAIRQGVNIEWFRTAASINEGVVYVWSDTRFGERDLYAQLIGPNGQKLWGETGLLVDDKNDRQEDPVIISTSDNCVVIAWVDFSDDLDGNIYAQKINAAGTKLWADGGVALCTAPKVQISLNIVPDNDGGAIVVWSDYRLSSIADYAQRVNSQGNVMWTANGVRIGVENANVGQNTFWEDGQNGAVIAFLAKNNNNITNIYIAHLSPTGSFSYGPMLLTNFTSSTSQPGSVRLAPSENNSFVLAWEQKTTGDENDYDIFIQKINSSGIKQWGDTGINITNNSSMQEKPRISASSNGNFFVVYEDQQYDNNINPDLFVQKFNSNGQAVWTSPTSLCQVPYKQAQARIASMDDGGCVVIWEDERDLNINNSIDVYAQRVNADGTVVWENNGKAISSLSGIQNGANVKISNNKIFFIWADQSQGSLSLTQQIVDMSNQLLYPANGHDIFEGLSANASDAKIFSHNSYAYITWIDERFAVLGKQIFVQKVAPNESLIFAENGIPITLDHSVKEEYNAMIDTDGNLIFFWLENIEGNFKPKAQKMSPNGVKIWGDNGILLSEDALAITNIGIDLDQIAGDYYFYWNDTNTINPHTIIRGQKISGTSLAWGVNGKTIVNKAPIPDDFDPENISVKVADLNKDFLAFYQKNDIYLIKLNSEGNPATGWTNAGLPFAVVPDFEKNPQVLLVDQGALVVWEDNRLSNAEFDIYAQIFTNDGQILLQQNGVPVVSFPEAQDQFVAKWNGQLTLAWRDYRDSNNDNYNIYLQRFNYQDNSLVPAWNTNGVGIAVRDSAQTYVDMELLGDKTVAVWEDAYDDHNIYMGFAGPQGNIIMDSVRLVNHIKKQTEPKIAKIDDYYAYVTWIDYISSGKEDIKGIYMQKVRAIHNSIDTPDISSSQLKVSQNYPNPFNPTTMISFNLKAKDRVKVDIFNVKGQKVKSLLNDVRDQGIHTLVWNGKDTDNNDVASGVYYYKVSSGSDTITKKMLLIK